MVVKRHKKLIHLKQNQINDLLALKDAIKDGGGTKVSTSQLIRDSIDLMLEHYQGEILDYYSPKPRYPKKEIEDV